MDEILKKSVNYFYKTKKINKNLNNTLKVILNGIFLGILGDVIYYFLFQIYDKK